MRKLTNEEKAILYNDMLRRYQMLQEQVRRIKAENINVSDNDQIKINELEKRMKHLYNETQKLYR
jgi:hypothetical protein